MTNNSGPGAASEEIAGEGFPDDVRPDGLLFDETAVQEGENRVTVRPVDDEFLAALLHTGQMPREQ